MIWLTYLTGLGMFTFGVYTKLVWLLTDWSAYLPVLFGLAYTTCAEGMRSLKRRQRVFLALAIVLSIVVVVTLYPLIVRVYDVVQGKAAEWDSGKLMQPDHVFQAAITASVAIAYLVIAIVVWLRQTPRVPPRRPTDPA